MTTRRLVLCLDGTWNSNDKGKTPTNIVKLLRSIPAVSKDGTSQILYYGRGVGTGAGDKVRGGFSGAGLEDNVIDGYRFLGNNYQPGDEIYLFGFSRGAYTARSLAGLIDLAGILQPSCLGGPLEELLTIRRSSDTRERKQQRINNIKDLQRHEHVRVKCVGVWDTVGSLGIPGDWSRYAALASRWAFHDVHLGPHIDVALHALAIDEKRPAFPPTLWEKPITASLPPDQIVEQVWFAGVHSNIGGSYPDSHLSDITLDWMIKRLKTHTRLEINHTRLTEQGTAKHIAGKGIESRTLLYHAMLSHTYPYLRTIGNVLTPPTGKVDDIIRNKLSPGSGRRNTPNDKEEAIHERLHISVLQRWQLAQVQHDAPVNRETKPQAYRPPNLSALIKHTLRQPAEQRIAVVGWDGEVIPAEKVPWPAAPRE